MKITIGNYRINLTLLGLAVLRYAVALAVFGAFLYALGGRVSCSIL